jgi:cold shock protein
MTKVMMFVDGTWLYRNTPRLGEVYGTRDFHINYGLLPKVLAEEVARQLGIPQVDLVRTYLFGSYPANYDLRDDEAVQRQLDFYATLKEEYHYEVETFPIDFRGRRLRREDRAPGDRFEPKEKCVDIALATAILYYAAIPHAYDVAMSVVGDRDYRPVLQHVRRLGKRVAICSIQGCCSPEYYDPEDRMRVKDFDMIWLNDLIGKIELKFERHQRECASPLHTGDRRVWTTYHPRKREQFFCEDCRRRFAQEKLAAQEAYVAAATTDAIPAEEGNGSMPAAAPVLAVGCSGRVKKLVRDRGFGFVQRENGNEYFFHLTDLDIGLNWETLEEGRSVTFDIRREPVGGKAGAAARIREAAQAATAERVPNNGN